MLDARCWIVAPSYEAHRSHGSTQMSHRNIADCPQITQINADVITSIAEQSHRTIANESGHIKRDGLPDFVETRVLPVGH